MRIVIAAQSETGETVLANLCSWSRSGLLSEFCWWPTPPDGSERGFVVKRIVRGELREESLSHALDQVDPDDVRLVGFYCAGPDGFDVRFADALQQRVDAAADVIRFRPAHPVRATMVVVQPAVGERVPAGLFRGRWLANVLMVAEYRRKPDAPNALADTPEMLPAHAANALATTADLWHDARPDRKSVLDGLVPGQVGPHPVTVVPVRCYSRIVDLGYLPDHLAASVFQRSSEAWPNPDRDHFERRSSPDEIVNYLTRRYLQKHEEVLGATPFTPVVPPPRPQLTILETLRWIWQELIRAINSKPIEMMEGLLAATVDRTAAFLEQHIGPDRPFDVVRWRERANRTGDLTELRHELDRPLVAPTGRVADTWRDLLALAFGLIDGSPLPEGIDAEVAKLDDRRLVVTAPDQIVPDPREAPPPSPDGSQPRACDPLTLRTQMAEEPAADDADAADLSEAAPPPASSPVVGRDGPVWIVGESIAEALLQGRAGAADPPPQPLPPEPTEQDRKLMEKARRKLARRQRRRARRGLLGRLLGPLVLEGAASWAVWTRLPLLLAGLAQGVLLIALGGVYVQLARRRYRRRQRTAREAIEQEVARLNETLKRSLCKGDEQRLAARYDEYLDWAEMIGWFAHDPWIGEALHRMDVRTPIDAATIPASMMVALGRVGERVESLRRQGQRQLFRPGWLSGLYAAVEHSVLEELRQEEGAASGTTAGARNTPLGATGGDSDTEGVPPPGEGGHEPDPLPPATAWFSPPENLSELYAALKPSIVRISVTDVAGERFGGTGVLSSRGGTIATARHVIEHAAEITVTFADGTEVPAEVMRTAAAADVAIIAAPPPDSATAAMLAPQDEQVVQGEPVITLGHPLLLDGEPTLAWGLITATDRHITIEDAPDGIGRFPVIQATYQSTGGASGSPVFDLEGRVIGIHSAGSKAAAGDERAQYMSSAVPTSALRELLAEQQAGLAPAAFSATTASTAPPPLDRDESLPEATAFLNEITGPHQGLSFLPDHWSDPTRGRPLVEDCLPHDQALVGDSARLGRAAGATRFLVPLRLGVHRVKIAKPVPPDDLACCADVAESEQKPTNRDDSFHQGVGDGVTDDAAGAVPASEAGL